MNLPSRLLPNRPLPDYSYVPGLWPHPHSQAGRSAERSDPLLDSELWSEDEPYVFGIDLWNHGFYWEAHEEWEWMWNAAGRKGPKADFFKGLIQLAVAGVKIREKRMESVCRHARRAAELFEIVSATLADDRFFGLSLRFLLGLSEGIADRPPLVLASDQERVRVVFSESLRPV